MRAARARLVTFAVAWLGACSSGGERANAFDDPGATAGSSDGPPSITTVASTIDPGSNTAPPDDSASDGTQGVAPTGTDDTGGATSSDADGSSSATSDGVSSDDGPSPGSSSSDDDGGLDTNPGSMTGACEPSGQGNYADCLAENQTIDTSVCGNAAATCIVNDLATPFIGGCAVQNCIDACGCPPAPATGDAPVVCEDLTGDALSECWLDCSDGASCPDGMFCFLDQVCLWPNANDGSVPYGDCATMGNAICGLESICLVDGPPQTIGVCSEPCTNVTDCSPAPPGGTAPVTCSQLVTGGPSECHLACGGGQTCPPGMSCFGNLLCAWDV